MWDQHQRTPSSSCPPYIVDIDGRDKPDTTSGLKYENLSGIVNQDRPDMTSGLNYENVLGVVSQHRPGTTPGLRYENLSGVVSQDTPARVSYQDCLSDVGKQDDRKSGEEYSMISDVVRRDNLDRASGEEYAMISDIDIDVKPDRTSGDEYDTIPDIIRHDKSNRTRCIPAEVRCPWTCFKAYRWLCLIIMQIYFVLEVHNT